jgi:selenocysteine lyase/cysteine desulfurase
MGVALVYNGLQLTPDHEILTTEQDYYVTHEALRLASKRTGVKVRKISLYEQINGISEDQIVDRLAQAITPATKVLAVTWVHSSTGLKLPLRRIADALDRINGDRNESDRVLFCVDAVHGFGIEDVTLADLGCDFLMAGCHKWLFGPRGTGIVWGRSEAWAEVSPTIPSFTDGESFVAWIEGRDPSPPTTASAFAPGGYHAFEHRWALADAFSFRQEIGRERAAERTHALATRLKEGLREIPGTTVRTPFDEQLSAGLVCCDEPVASTVERLRAEHGVVASLTPYATRYLRFGPSIVNSEEDVDRAVAAVAAISA